MNGVQNAPAQTGLYCESKWIHSVIRDFLISARECGVLDDRMAGEVMGSVDIAFATAARHPDLWQKAALKK